MENIISIQSELAYIKPYYKSLKRKLLLMRLKHWLKNNSLSHTAKLSVASILLLSGASETKPALPILQDTKQDSIVYLTTTNVTIDSATKQFMQAIGMFESCGNYKAIGIEPQYLGKYQIGDIAREQVGLKGFNSASGYKEFLNNAELQDITMYLLVKQNYKFLKEVIPLGDKGYVGRYYVTTSGLLAMAHLVGASEVIKFVKSNGTYIPKDGAGTKATMYLIFNNHNLSLK